MALLTLRDATELYYKDWGSGKPVLFSHGWPLSADMWDAQMLFLAERGYRTVAFDRRGFGRSDQPWTGYDYDTFADDIADLVKHLDLKDVMLVGFSMGGGDITRYVARHGTSRVSKLVLLSAVTPLFVKTADHDGVDKSVFDGIRAGLVKDRPQFLDDFSPLLRHEPRHEGVAGHLQADFADRASGLDQSNDRLRDCVFGNRLPARHGQDRHTYAGDPRRG